MAGLTFPPTHSAAGGFPTTASVDKAAAGPIAVNADGPFCVLTLFKLPSLSEVIFGPPFLQLVPREGSCGLRGGDQPLPNQLLLRTAKTLYVSRVREMPSGFVQPCSQVFSAIQDSWHVNFGSGDAE